LALWLVSLLVDQATTASHGLTGSYRSTTGETDTTVLVRRDRHIAFNNNDLRYIFQGQPFAVEWQGFVRFANSGNYVFILETDGGASLWVDDHSVIEDQKKHPVAEVVAQTNLEAGVYPIRLRYVQPDGNNANSTLYLLWKRPDGGREIIPTESFYPGRPASSLAGQDVVPVMRHLGRIGLWLWLVGLALVAAVRLGRLSGRERMGLLLIFLVALGLRLVYVFEIEKNDPLFYSLRPGSDHLFYEATARGLAQGWWPGDALFYFHPLMSFYLFFVHELVGESLFATRIFQTVVGALGCVLVYLIGKKALGTRPGLMAGGMAAVYGVFIFYDASLLADPLSGILNLAALLGFLWLAEEQNWMNILWTGVALGLSALSRTTILAFVPLALLWMLLTLRISSRRVLATGAAVVLVMFAVIAPVTLRNYLVSKQFVLITAMGGAYFYFGNSPESTGRWAGISPEFAALTQRVGSGETTWEREALAAIQRDPIRWLQLLMRKLGLFWGNYEIPGNVDYYQEGQTYSWLLNVLPLDFRLVSLLGLAGVALSWKHWRKTALLVFFTGTHMASLVLLFVEARYRLPVVPVMIVLAAYTVDVTVSSIRQRDYRGLVTKGLVPVLGAGVLLSVFDYVAWALPSPPALILPSTAHPADVTYDDKFRLVAYEVEHREVRPGEKVRLTLYWQGLQQMKYDYSLFIHLVSRDGRGIAQQDVTYPTTLWQVQHPISTAYELAVPASISGPWVAEVRVGWYRGATRLPAWDAQGRRLPGEAWTLAPLKIAAAATSQPHSPLDIRLGNELALIGFDLAPATAMPGESVRLGLFWRARDKIEGDYKVFVHIVNEVDQIVAQDDQQPVGGNYPTSLWEAGEVVQDEHRLNLPSSLPPGEYRLFAGMYRTDTLERLTAINAQGERLPADRIPLAKVRVGR